MYREELPIVWYDIERVSPEEIARALAHDPRVTFIPVSGDPQQALGQIRVPYPTPDDLFRWRPRPTALLEYTPGQGTPEKEGAQKGAHGGIDDPTLRGWLDEVTRGTSVC